MNARLEHNVRAAADRVLARQQFVAPIDLLLDLGWLSKQDAENWWHGRALYLEQVVRANLHKLSTALRLLSRWAHDNNLFRQEAVYVGRTARQRPLRFTKTGDKNIERAYRTHFVHHTLINAERRSKRKTPATPPQ
jgi:hypothetical protein